MNALAIVPCAWLMAACADDSPAPSYQNAAMQASERGDHKAAISLTRKEVARYSEPSQCSATNSLNCGTLALAYGTLASYQILDGDKTGGEASFGSARGALNWTDPAIKASATAMVYRDVSEAYWQTGDRERAMTVFKAGGAAGGDQWLYMSSAGRAAAAEELPAQAPPAQEEPIEKVPAQKARAQKAPVPKAPDSPIPSAPSSPRS